MERRAPLDLSLSAHSLHLPYAREEVDEEHADQHSRKQERKPSDDLIHCVSSPSECQERSTCCVAPLLLLLHTISSGEEKTRYVRQLGPTSVIAFGNAMNDVGMLRLAAISVAILVGEGVAIGALQAADVLALGPIDAIGLLNPKRLVATLRG
jgi:hydroxymethylpyrimidine pyrophosphatase-like HAD family hydrolase